MTAALLLPDPLPAPPEDDDALDVAPARRSALLRTALVAAATVAALPFSLAALVTDFHYAAALGEIVLVPVCALVLALVAAWRHPWTAALRPGRADWVLAAAGAALAAALVVVGPVLAGNVYYALRPDLLALPLVAGAAVCLLFGVRALLAFVVPLAVAALSWPLPLRALLEPAAHQLTAATAAALRLGLHVLPLAEPVRAAGDLRLRVAAPTGPFDVVVASACSGTTGVAGTLLVGLAAQYVLHGTARARVRWLTAAVVGAWALNLVRILLLLLVGRLLGERAALDVVHPVAGLVLLNASFAALVLAAPRFGLRVGLSTLVPADTPLTAPAPAAARMTSASLRRRGAAVAAGAAVLGLLNATVPGTAGAYVAANPAARAFSDAPTPLPGFALADSTTHEWSQVYYGRGSSWLRYRLLPTSGAPGFSLWLDSVTTPDWAALRAHPLLDCYRFHGFAIERTSRAVLAAGVLADEVVHRRPDGATWHVLSWEWPVRSGAEGSGLRHERVVLLASSERTDLSPGPATDGAPPSGTGLRALLAARAGASGGADPNPGLAAALRRTADDLIRSRLSEATA